MNQGVRQKPIQMIVLDQCRRTFPYVDVCPRCSVRSQLILGLKKTPAVCIDCAIDPTWCNPQENWSEGGVVMHQGQEFQGDIGPSRIIIQHPKYTVFEQVHGNKELVVLHNYSRRAYHLPRRNGKAFDVAKSQMPNASPTQALKTSVHSCPLLTSLLTGNQEAQLSQFKVSKKQVEPEGDRKRMNQPGTKKSSDVSLRMCGKAMASSTNRQATLSDLATSSAQSGPAKRLMQQNANQTRVTAPSISKDNYHLGKIVNAMANPSLNTNLNESRLAHDQNWVFSGNQYEAMTNAYNPNQMGVDLHNIQQVHSPGSFCYASRNTSQNNAVDLKNCYVQTCRKNWIPNQDISQIQCEGTPVYAPHANLPMVGIGEERAVPPEGAVNWRFRVPEENIHQIESANRSDHKLSGCYPNSIFCYELDKQNALPKLAASTELNWPPKCANNWTYNVEKNNITQSNTQIPNRKQQMPDNCYVTSIFCSNVTIPILVTPVIHKQQVQESQATNWTCNMTTHEKQMNTETLAIQNLENWQSAKPCGSEFVNPQASALHATSTEQVGSPKEAIDLTYKIKRTENHTQSVATKQSNQKIGSLSPSGILNSDLVIAKSLSTSMVQAKPLEEGNNMVHKMARQEDCTEIAKTSKQQALRNKHPYSILILPSTKLLSTSKEQVEPPEKKTETTNIMTTQENLKQIKIEEAGNNKVVTQHLQAATSDSRVETLYQDKYTQIDREEPSNLTNVDADTSGGNLYKFENIEDFMNAIKSRMFESPNVALKNAAKSNVERDLESDNEDKVCIVSDHESTSQAHTCEVPILKETGKTTDCTEIGKKWVQNDSSVTLKEQVLNKETVGQFEQSLVQDDETRDASKLQIGVGEETMPRIQKAVSKQLKRRQEREIERKTNDVDCAEFGGKQSAANESHVTEATQKKASMSKNEASERKLLNTSNSNCDKHCKTLTESTMRGSNVYKERLRDDPTVSASSPIEKKFAKIQEDTGNLMDCTDESLRLNFQDFKCEEKFEANLSTKIYPNNNNNETCDESKNHAKETIHELRRDSPWQIGTMTICKVPKVQLFNIARGEAFKGGVLEKTYKTDVTSQRESSHASKIVELLVKQHDDWRDWSLEIDSESGLVLRNGKSISGAESLPMHLGELHSSASSEDDTVSMKKGFKEKRKRQTTEYDQFVAKKPRTQKNKLFRDRKGRFINKKLAKRWRVSQDPKRHDNMSSEDLPKNHASTGKSIQEGFRQIITISKQKSHLKMKKKMLKMAACHVRKMYFTEKKTSIHNNQDKGYSVTYFAKPKSVQNSSKACSNKDYKAGQNPNQQLAIPVNKTKQVRKRENSNNDAKSKDGRTMPSVKLPQDPKRQSTLQIKKCRPKELPKSANEKKVTMSLEEYLKLKMERSKQESCCKIKKKSKNLLTKTTAFRAPNLQDPTESKESGHYNQDKGNCRRSDKANDKEETMLRQNLPQCSKNLQMFHQKDERSKKPATGNFSLSAKPKSVERSLKASSSNNYKKGVKPKNLFNPKKYKKKYQTEGHANKGERSNKNDNRKTNRTMHSVKISQDLKRVSAFHFQQCRPEHLPKNASARKVGKPVEKDFRRAMKKQENLSKLERKEKQQNYLTSQVQNIQNNNQDRVHFVRTDRAEVKEKPIRHQDSPQSSKARDKAKPIDVRSKKSVKDNVALSVKTKSAERSYKESSNKGFKEGIITEQQSQYDIKKQVTQKHVSRNVSDTNDNCKAKRTMLSVKRPQDQTRQSTLQMNKCSAEDLFKYVIPRKVGNQIEEDFTPTNVERKATLPNKMAVSHVQNLQNPTDNKEPRLGRQENVNCVSGDMAYEEEETMSSQDLPQHSIDLDKVNQAAVSSQKPAQNKSEKPKNIERSTTVSSNRDDKKGMNTKIRFPHKSDQKKHRNQEKECKSEISNENVARWTDRAIPLFDLEISKNVVFRRKRYSKWRKLRKSKSTKKCIQMEKGSKDIDHHKVQRATHSQSVFVNPNTYHATLEFTNPNYITMCEQIEDSINNEKALQSLSPITVLPNCKDHGTTPPRLVDLHMCHANLKCTDPDYIAMCKRIEDSITEDKANKASLLTLEMPQDLKKLGDQQFARKPCTIPSQDERRDLERQVTDVEIKRNKNKKSNGDVYGKAHRTMRPSASRRDRRRSRHTSYEREQHSDKQRRSHRQECRGGSYNVVEYRKVLSTDPNVRYDRRNDGKFHRERKTARREIEDPRLSNDATSQQNFKTRELQINNPVKDIQIYAFDGNNRRINLNTREKNIYSWSELRIQTVLVNREQKSVQKQDFEKHNDKLQGGTTLFTAHSKLDLVFTEWGYVSQSLKKASLPVFFFKHRNNTLEITVSKHANWLWACARELSESGTFLREKNFIANYRKILPDHHPFYLDCNFY